MPLYSAYKMLICTGWTFHFFLNVWWSLDPTSLMTNLLGDVLLLSHGLMLGLRQSLSGKHGDKYGKGNITHPPWFWFKTRFWLHCHFSSYNFWSQMTTFQHLMSSFGQEFIFVLRSILPFRCCWYCATGNLEISIYCHNVILGFEVSPGLLSTPMSWFRWKMNPTEWCL